MSTRKQALVPSDLSGTISRMSLNNLDHVPAPSWHWPYYLGLEW